MRCLVLTLILAASLCSAAPRCPDPRLRKAKIGGDVITGGVVLHKEPLKFVQVRLYSSSDKMPWRGKTDKNGRFVLNNMAPDEYRLEVSGWGATTVQLMSPDYGKRSNGQNTKLESDAHRECLRLRNGDS
jgi:hypothetical protein